ncbi:UNVERIFIED_CONTAM: AarF domain-containing protein kinase [Sesamum radiatum]|uniref:AarF domain-containing protein kinase n=1 Tax=Sesamum radiatum TaxID=300843 RepID=A0AAW2MEW6_SESRA
MGWGNIYKRRVKVFSLAIIIYIDYKVLQHREKWTKNSKRADLWDKAHERNARRVLKLIVKLEGLWVKLGQYLSTRADVLPPAYIRLLKQLQDSLPPRPLKEVCQTITTELGKSMADLFLNFDNTPLATASIAQVHRATLADGKEVVVKVQHEGIKEIILEDLKNAKSIVDWIAWAEPQYDFNPMIDEWCKEAPKELDFNHEAENTRKVSRNLGCKSNCDDNNINRVDVLIPEVITSSEKVLILEYMDGVRLNDSESLQALGVDKQKLVEEITRAYAHQIYVDGFFNGDPHPGNFLVSKAPPHRPVLLDFGLTKKLSFPMKQALAKMFLASAEGDHVALLSSFAEMGLKLRLDIPEQVMEISSVFFRNSTPANEAHQTMKSFADRRTKNLKVLQEKMKLNEKEVKRFNPHASRKKFQEILEEAFIRPLNIDGELYIGIPPGVESRLATLTSDLDDIKKLSEVSGRPGLPSSFQLQDLSQMASTLPALFNTLHARRAIIPAANAHCSARALARYYAALVDEGAIPPPHSSSTQPQLGSHPHIPEFPSQKPTKKRKGSKHAHNTDSSNSTNSSREDSGKTYTGIPTDDSNCNGTISVAIDGFGNDRKTVKLFSNSKIHDAFTGVGEYENLTLPGGQFGLGFKRSYSEDGNLVGFGHSGMGGSTGYCDINHRFSIAVTLNKMNFGGVTAKVIQLVCSELNIPLPADFYRFTERINDNESNVVGPLIN